MYESVLEAFERADLDRNGHIDQAEFAQLIADLGASLGPEELAETFAALDANANGLIDFSEFVGWWRRQRACA